MDDIERKTLELKKRIRILKSRLTPSPNTVIIQDTMPTQANNELDDIKNKLRPRNH